MKAWNIAAFGGPEVLEEVELPRPRPGPNELLVKVHATSVNPVDCKLRRDGRWAGIVPPAILGFDVAGVVEEVGVGVAGFSPQDAVFYSPLIFGMPGSYAEYHVVPAGIVALKPQALTFLEAAAVPLAGCTAWDAVVGLARVSPGDTVLVHAGAGGVGSLCVQLAALSGARVLCTARAANAAWLRDLGADVVVDPRREDVWQAVLKETDGAGVDVAVDTVGGETLSRTVGVMKPRGRMVTMVDVAGDLNGAYGKNLSVHFLFMERAGHKMEALRRLLERGQLKPVVDSVMQLSQVAAAHRRLEAGGLRGKIVLQVTREAAGTMGS